MEGEPHLDFPPAGFSHVGFSPVLQKRLDSLDPHSSRRVLSSRVGLDFSSNDYLGFSGDHEFRRRILEVLTSEAQWMGSGGSRLLRGNLKEFESAEAVLADFCSRESAILFPSGYQANLGLLSAILKPGDIVFSDQFNHASIIDGIRLSGADKKVFPHADIPALRKLLEVDAFETVTGASRLKVIVTESIFSMDGDLAPLCELAELAEEFTALLIVDEAHATGLWGDGDLRGGGWVQKLGLTRQVFATVHTAGKSLGLAGAWVCGGAQLKDYLVNYSRPFIFSTAPTPFLAWMLQVSISYWKEVGQARAQTALRRSEELQDALHCARQNTLQDSLQGALPCVSRVPGPIVPVRVGGNEEALSLAKKLQELGFDVRAIRPPTVPAGSARLRLTVNSSHSVDDIQNFSKALSRLL